MRTATPHIVAASLLLLAAACDGSSSTTFDVPTDGSPDSAIGSDVSGPDATPDGTADAAPPDTTADTGPTTPPECDGVTCDNDGECVVVGSVGVCACPPGTSGGVCQTRCDSGPLPMMACSSITTPDVWWTSKEDDDCGRTTRFALSAPAAGEVLLTGEFNGWATGAGATALTDDDGDGTWETAVNLGEGTQAYKFIVDGVAQTDPAQGVSEPDGAGGLQTVIDVGECASAATVDSLACRRLFPPADTTYLRCDATGGPGCLVGGACLDGCVRDAWLAVDLGSTKAVTGLSFRSDWWSKRPRAWELWASDSPDVMPGSGATKVSEGTGQVAPWQCVTGEACTEEVPADECCPAGASQPQSIPEGELISKFDLATFTGGAGRYWWFKVVDTHFANEMYMQGLALSGNDCLPGTPAPPSTGCNPSPCFTGVPCTPVGADGYSCGPCPMGTSGDGETCVGQGGCNPNPCFAGVSCTPVGASDYTCGPCPSGTSGDGETCAEVDGCAGSPCYPGVSCTDVKAPGTGFTCGPCPAGTTGNGETCTPVAPPECEVANDCSTDGTKVCSGGKCQVKSCSGQSQCGSGYCFKGKCAIGAGSCEAACQQTYGSQTWLCDGSGYCQIRNCSKSKACPGGQECVSRFDNNFGPGGGSTASYKCESDGSSPCGGACSSSQICSSESEPPKCF